MDKSLNKIKKVSPIVKDINKNINITIRAMDRLYKASVRSISTKSFDNFNKSIQKLNNSVTRLKSNVQQVSKQARNIPNINTSASQNKLNSSSKFDFKGVATGIAEFSKKIIESINRATSYLDNMNNVNTQLGSIDKDRTSGEVVSKKLQNKVVNSAIDSGTSYADFVSTLSTFGSLASEQFNGNDEIIQFTNTLYKMFGNVGASESGISTVISHLTQAMSAGKLAGGMPGKLNGSAVRDIVQFAPELAKAISTEMEIATKDVPIPIDKLVELANEGILTSDIIKQAMTNAATDVNATFNSLPMSFGQNIENMKTRIVPIITDINKMFYSWMNDKDGSGGKFFSAIELGFIFMANAAALALHLIISGINMLMENLDVLLPVIIATAIVGFGTLAFFLIQAAIAAIAAGAGFLVACWPILLIIALVALVIMVLNSFGITTGQIIGFIIGAFFALGAIVFNIVIGLINILGGLGAFIATLANGILLTFTNMGEDIMNCILWVAKGIQNFINMIPGVEINIVSKLENIKDMIVKTQHELESKDTNFKPIEFIDISDAFDKGMKLGTEGFKLPENKSKYNTDNKKNSNNSFIPGITNSAGTPSNIASGMPSQGFNQLDGGRLDEVGKINDDISIEDEDIKLLKDIATTKFVNQYTTLRPNMNVTFGDIKETADANAILKAIEYMTEQALANTIIEGV